MIKYYLLTAAMCVAPFLFAQTEVVSSQERAGFSNGVSYNLPKTVLGVEVEAVKTIKLAGPYYRYSERYLGTKDVITENSTTWSVKSVKIVLKSKPDPNNSFTVKLDPASGASYITLTPDGTLFGVNVPFKQSHMNSSPAAQNETTPNLSFSGAVLNEEALQANSVAKMAELSAKQIYRIRDSRLNLITGDNDKLPDGDALALMLSNLDKSEKELTALFVGKTVSVSSTITFDVTPEKLMKNEVLFRLSTLGGVVSKDDLSGQPYYINVADISDKNIPVSQKSGPSGLYYRMPGVADVSVIDPTGNILINKKINLAQFGTVQALSASIFNKNTVKIQFDPLTGALISIEK
jgi:hypothetical protein